MNLYETLARIIEQTGPVPAVRAVRVGGGWDYAVYDIVRAPSARSGLRLVRLGQSTSPRWPSRRAAMEAAEAARTGAVWVDGGRLTPAVARRALWAAIRRSGPLLRPASLCREALAEVRVARG